MITSIHLAYIFDILQYGLLSLILAITISKIFHTFLYKKTKKQIHEMNIYFLILDIFIELILLIFVSFYINSFLSEVPSLSSTIIKNVTSNKTLEFAIHIGFLYFLLELFPLLKYKIELLKEKLYL